MRKTCKRLIGKYRGSLSWGKDYVRDAKMAEASTHKKLKKNRLESFSLNFTIIKASIIFYMISKMRYDGSHIDELDTKLRRQK